MKLVTVDDCAEADEMFGVIMGDMVRPRREFIAGAAEGLDFGMLDF